MSNLLKPILTLAVLWLFGLVIFVSKLPTESQSRLDLAQTALPENSGIVVYTGGGGARISKAMELFGQGIAKRLLISGVHPDTTQNHLEKLWDGDKTRFSCCLDLGLEAQTTRGNAHELVQWAIKNNFSAIVLVTSDYHLPRAVAETKALAANDGTTPSLKIIPYATPSQFIEPSSFPTDVTSWTKLSIEYSKYLLASADIFIKRIWP